MRMKHDTIKKRDNIPIFLFVEMGTDTVSITVEAQLLNGKSPEFSLSMMKL